MEQEISGISEFTEKRTTSRGELKFLKRISGKFSVPFDFELEFLEILVEWNAPTVNCYRNNQRLLEIRVVSPD